MNNPPATRPSVSSTTTSVLATDEFDSLVEQLKEAYPSATDRLLAQAITEGRKEVGDDREQLLRCVRERITA